MSDPASNLPSELRQPSLALSQRVLRAVAGLFALVSVTAFAAAMVIGQRPQPSDFNAAVASALIGCLVLLASVVTWRTSRHPPGRRPPASTITYFLLKIISIGLGVLLWGSGLIFLWNILCLLEWEWLQWIPTSMRPVRLRSNSSLIVDAVKFATVFGSLGTFFLWFGFRRRKGQPPTVHPL